MQDGCSGTLGFLGAMALVTAAALGLGGIYSLDVRVVAAIALGAVCFLAAVGFVMLKVDRALRWDLEAGIKLIAFGRISRMDSEEIAGPGFLTVVIEEAPPREIKFFVESRLYRQVKTEDVVRMAYVPRSKTILQLRTEHCRYCRHPDSDKGTTDAAK